MLSWYFNYFSKSPEVELGLKSVLFIELIARGGNKDIHSLNFPLVPSPPWELVHALSTIMTSRNIFRLKASQILMIGVSDLV